MNADRLLYLALLVASIALVWYVRRLEHKARQEREAHDRRWRALIWQIGESTKEKWDR
jgi:hypothetical protein